MFRVFGNFFVQNSSTKPPKALARVPVSEPTENFDQALQEARKRNKEARKKPRSSVTVVYSVREVDD